jgi:hypothetical protein
MRMEAIVKTSKGVSFWNQSKYVRNVIVYDIWSVLTKLSSAHVFRNTNHKKALKSTWPGWRVVWRLYGDRTGGKLPQHLHPQYKRMTNLHWRTEKIVLCMKPGSQLKGRTLAQSDSLHSTPCTCIKTTSNPYNVTLKSRTVGLSFWWCCCYKEDGRRQLPNMSISV